MLHHVILWQHQEHFSKEEKATNAQKVKEQLEALKDTIPEVLSMRVEIHPLSSGTADVALFSTFKNEEDLEIYRVHEEHQKVVSLIHETLCNRLCMDYIGE